MNDQTNIKPVYVDRQRFSQNGDIRQAMSADVIATTWNSTPIIRQPFSEEDRLYVTTSVCGDSATAYLLAPTTEGAVEKKSPDGFSNRKVQFKSQFFIIQGPSCTFSAKTEEEAAAPAQPPASDDGSETDDFIASLDATEPSAQATAAPAATDQADGDGSGEEENEPDEEAGAPDESEAPHPSPPPQPLATAQAKATPAAPPEIKKTYTELLPDRSYDLEEAPLKLFFTIFEPDGHVMGREIRITAQLYRDAPLILRVRDREVGGTDKLYQYATERVAETLEARKAAYAHEQQEAARQVEANREKEIAEKLRQKAREKKRPATTAKPTTVASTSPTAATTTAQGAQSSLEPAASTDEEHAEDATDEAETSDDSTDNLDNMPVVSDDSKAKPDTTPTPAPPTSVKRQPPSRSQSSDTQASLFG